MTLRLRFTQLLGTILVVGACWPPLASHGQTGANPPGQTTAAAEKSKSQTEAFTKSADYSAQHGGRALLVMQNGEIQFERYDNTWTADRPHILASGTKSFTGIMAMLAVQDGILQLDELASDTLTEWKSDPRKSKITVRHLLTLSSGLPSGDRELSGNRSGAALLGEVAAARAKRLGIDDAGPRPDNLNLKALELEAVSDPGAKFQYGPSHFYAFSELLQRKLKKSDQPQKTTLDYLQKRILEPVGINAARIGRDRAGNPNLPGGMLLTAREWSKFGQFVLDDGSVRQPDGSTKNLLKPELLKQCFEPSKANPSYGLTWWLRSADPEADVGGGLVGGGGLGARLLRKETEKIEVTTPDGKPLRVYMAAGLGKQRLYVIPSYKLVIVRFAEATAKGLKFNDRELLEPIIKAL